MLLLLGSQFNANAFIFKPTFDLRLSVLFTVTCTVKCTLCIASENQGGLVRVPAGFVLGAALPDLNPWLSFLFPAVFTYLLNFVVVFLYKAH